MVLALYDVELFDDCTALSNNIVNPKLLFSYPFKPYLPSSSSHFAEQILVLYVSIGILYYMRSIVDASLTVNFGVLELSG